MNPSTTKSSEYRTTIYLNNAGIKLLKNNCLYEAKQVFTNATWVAWRCRSAGSSLANGTITGVLDTAMVNLNDNRLPSLSFGFTNENIGIGLDNSNSYHFAYQQMIQQADKYVAKIITSNNPLVLLNESYMMELNLDEDECIHLTIITCDNPSIPTTTNRHGVGSILNLVRIESSTFYNCQNEIKATTSNNNSTTNAIDMDWHLLTSVLLHNLAITYHRVAQHITVMSDPSYGTTSISIKNINIASYRLLHISYTLALTLLGDYFASSPSSASGAEVEAAILLTKITSLAANTVQSLVYMGNLIQVKESHLQEYHRRFQNYSTYLTNYHDEKRKILSVKTSPAA